MKKLPIFLLFILTDTFFLVIFSATNTFGQLNVGLKANYSFGGNANDISGHTNNGSLVGSPALTSDRFGTPNCAYQFPGDTSNYITVNYSTDFNISPTGSFSISLWFEGGTPSLGDFEILFEKNDSAVTPIPSDYHLALYDLNNPSFGSQYSPVVMSSIPNTVPAWHHVVGVYDNKNWYIYEDDTLRSSDLTQTNMIFQSTGNITIGKNFLGKLDDIRFYDRVLTSGEVHQLYVLAGSCAVSSINEFQLQPDIAVFPNPTTGVIHLTSEEHILNISVFDINGRELIRQVVNGQKATLDLGSSPDGLYLIRTTGSEFIQNRIIRKQN